MDQIRITLAQVSKHAGVIRNQSAFLHQCLEEFHINMNQLNADWHSLAASTIQQRFQTMLPMFQQYRDIVDRYANFLDQTVQQYESMEQKINAYANTI